MGDTKIITITILIGLNNFAMDIPRVGSSCPLFSGWIRIQMLVFVEGDTEDTEDTEKSPRSKEENQRKTQPTRDTRSVNRTQATVV